MTIEIRSYREEDFQRISLLRKEAFRRPTSSEDWLRDGLVLFDKGQIAAALRIHRFPQLFGGRSLSSAMVTSVMVAPEARGRGHGTALLQAAITAMRQAGVAISTLYPSTMAVYRKVGYEIAGARVSYRCPIWAVPSTPTLPVAPWSHADLDAVAICYQRFATHSNGLMERSREWWQRFVLAPGPEGDAQCYLVQQGEEVMGYIVYVQQPVATSDPADYGYYFSFACRDFVWTDRDSASALLAFIAASRAFASEARWYGSIDDTLSTLFEQEAIEVEQTARWMARLIDLEGALETRGYPAALDAALELTVTDPTTQSACAIRLDVQDGAASVNPIERARAQIDIGALTAMFTGWMSAHDACRLGRLVNATSAEAATADALFGGPKPWLLELF